MFSIKIPDVKTFMNHLLKEDTFDHFQLCEASIRTSCTYHLDGRLNYEFYSTDEAEQLNQRIYAYWMEQKPLVFQLIKGKKTPLSFKIVFLLAPSNVEKLVHQNNLPLNVTDISGLFLNLHYDQNTLTLTSGTSLKIFTMDKTLDHIWDDNLKKFLRQKQLPFELL